jgi:hypothetical protein
MFLNLLIIMMQGTQTLIPKAAKELDEASGPVSKVNFRIKAAEQIDWGETGPLTSGRPGTLRVGKIAKTRNDRMRPIFFSFGGIL